MKNPANIETCISTCRECRDECQTTLFRHCLETGGKHVEAKHFRLMADCIQICETAADFMMRCSEMDAAICVACATICDACAKSCDQIGGEQLKRCAEMCRQCSAACREMGKTRKVA